MGFLFGKKALIAGVASDRSIAWGVAKAMHRQGAELAFTYYPSRKLHSRVKDMAKMLDSEIVLPCDVRSDEQIISLYAQLNEFWSKYDILVHSIASAPKNELQGTYVESVTREGFQIAHEISSYSFVSMARAGLSMMEGNNASLLTFTYIGSIRSTPGYNVMGLAKASLEANVRYMAHSLGRKGIRVNGISSGPIYTLSASGIKNFKTMLHHFENITPLGRAITLEELGNTAAFLSSDLASGITGEIIYVDGGFHIVGNHVD